MIQSMPWSSWLRLWARHAQTPGFSHRLRGAVELCRSGAEHAPYFASLSGGKDSAAMVGVMVEAGLSGLQCAVAHSSLTTPGSVETAVAICDKYGLPLDGEEPDSDPLEVLRDLPTDADALSGPSMDRLYRVCGAGNLMVNYAYKSHAPGVREGGGFVASFQGLRADESRGRRASLATHGPVYRNNVDGMWRVCPLARWTVRDVYAYCVSRGEPIHPFYQRYCDELGGDPEGHGARVDLVVAPDTVAQRGALQPVRRLYPELWAKLLRVRPEIARYG
jgi:3'-phosphoadenosine 5'-phosphosulfate sulfotransferase (PAPS reductase)/FAD synthetase